jgi:L-arabinose isomerase
VLPLIQRAGVPVVVLNLQPEAAIDYRAFNRLEDRTAMTGEWLAHCSACPVPEIANLLKRAQIHFHQVTGVLDEALTWQEIEEWLAAARVRSALASSRLGLMGHYYSGMLDIMTDVTLGISLLTARHIPVTGEYEVKNAMAMKIMDLLGAGGSFTEYYAMDFNDDLVLMGHDGPGHIAIAQGKTKVRPLKVYHGKVGRGLSVEMSVRYGPVTLLSVVEDADSRFKLVVAEGECIAGEILEIGNTNSRYRFPLGARGFVNAWNEQGPAHHCAVGVGHVAATLEKAATLMGIVFHQVC